MQITITANKLHLFKDRSVVHDFQGVEDVSALDLGSNQSVLEEYTQFRFRRSVVITVGGGELVVLVIVDNGRLNVEEGDEVGDLLGGGIFDDVAAKNIFTGSQEMLDFGLGERGVNGESKIMIALINYCFR